MSRAGIIRAGVAATLLVYGVAASVWLTVNVGVVPSYGDTAGYLKHMQDLEVDAYRGFVYPVVLAAAAHVTGSRESLAQYRQRAAECGPACPQETPAALVAVQLLQLAASLLGLFYFVRVFVRDEPGRSRSRQRLLLLTLLFLDPLVAHFNLSILTDGLALSASLGFAAALTDAVVERRHPRLAPLVLVASTFVLVGLRPEKRYVVAATVVTAVAVWSWRATSDARRRSLVALGLVGATLVLALLAQSRLEAPSGRAPVLTTIVHQRIVYPHLEEIHPDLPHHWKARLSIEMAADYDEHIIRARKVVARVAAGDAELTRWFTEDTARIALRQKWPAILLDIVKDSVENFFATLSFYGRVGLWSIAGDAAFERMFVPDGSRWTVSRLSMHAPQLSRLYLCAAAGVLVVAACGCAAQIARSARHRPRPPERVRADRDCALRFVPVVSFAAFNAVAFAATADLVHVRYVLFAHVAFLAVLYASLPSLLRRAPQPPASEAGRR